MSGRPIIEADAWLDPTRRNPARRVRLGDEIYDKDGRLENPGFLDYRVPVASDAPDLSSLFISRSAPSSGFAAATLLPDYANREISWKYDKI